MMRRPCHKRSTSVWKPWLNNNDNNENEVRMLDQAIHQKAHTLKMLSGVQCDGVWRGAVSGCNIESVGNGLGADHP